MLYNKKLEEMGLSNSRQADLASAIAMLHASLCKLDTTNLKLIKEKGLNKMLEEFAKAEELRLIQL